jgi:hypothetical protein
MHIAINLLHTRYKSNRLWRALSLTDIRGCLRFKTISQTANVKAVSINVVFFLPHAFFLIASIYGRVPSSSLINKHLNAFLVLFELELLMSQVELSYPTNELS